MRPLVFGLGVGMALQAWRNFPADGPVSADMSILLCAVAMLAAYFAGKKRRGDNTAVAVATAEATAIATNQVNVAFVVPGGGASTAGHGSAVPVMEMPWMQERPAVTSDQLDGLDLSEFIERETEEVE